MQLQSPPLSYSPTEYLELEEQSECRHAYQDGEIIEMTGGSFLHNQISLSLALSLRLISKQQNYSICMVDMRLWIPRYRQYTYPDVMVIAGEPIFQEKRTDTVINPIFIAEVLSKSTSAYDPCGICEAARGDKFAYYRSIREMREYVLIDQYTCHMEHFSKTEQGKWLLTEYESLTDQLVLPAIALQIPLKELYDRINFESVEVQPSL